MDIVEGNCGEPTMRYAPTARKRNSLVSHLCRQRCRYPVELEQQVEEHLHCRDCHLEEPDLFSDREPRGSFGPHTNIKSARSSGSFCCPMSPLV
jgi:hypothetical protein